MLSYRSAACETTEGDWGSPLRDSRQSRNCPCSFPAKALCWEENLPARGCPKRTKQMCKYLIGRLFFAISRIDSRPKGEFLPASREFSHLGCAAIGAAPGPARRL